MEPFYIYSTIFVGAASYFAGRYVGYKRHEFHIKYLALQAKNAYRDAGKLSRIIYGQRVRIGKLKSIITQLSGPTDLAAKMNKFAKPQLPQ